MKVSVLFILIAVILSCTCHDDERLVSAERFLPSNPQAADSILSDISDIRALNDADKVLYGLLRTYTDNRLGREIVSDSLIRPAYDYYHGKYGNGSETDTTSVRRYAQCCYYMGIYYADRDSTKQSGELLRFAIKESERVKDWHTCYLAYTRLSNSLLPGNADMALEASQKAYEAYQNIKDDINNEVLILCKIGGCYAVMEDFDKSLSYYNEAYRIADENGLHVSKNQVCMCLANVYWGKEAYTQALSYAKEGVLTADSSVLANSLITLSACYIAVDSLDKAKSVLQSVECKPNDYMGKYLVMHHFCDIEIKRLHADSLKCYADSASICLERMYFDALNQKSEYYRANIQKEIENEKINIQSERNKWLFVIFTVILILAAIFTFSIIKYRQRIEGEEYHNAISYERSQNTILQMKIKHREELLHQKSISLSLMQKYFMDKLASFSRENFESERVDITDEVWDEIERLLNYADNNFVERLSAKYQKMRREDIRFCMLVRMKLKNSTIGKVFNIQKSAVQKRKQSLKKNIFQINDPEKHFDQIIEMI